MSGDLAILVPSRGRPANVARLISACHETCTAATDLWFGFDLDDPQFDAYMKVTVGIGSAWVTSAERMHLGPWTNYLWRQAPGYRAYASFGDDHVPRTPGWDTSILEALDAIGGGIAWPRDIIDAGWPEAAVLSAEVCNALGWVCEPSMEHYSVDVVWKDLGELTGRLIKMDVLVEHIHPRGGKIPDDATYREAVPLVGRDHAAWEKWRAERARADAARIRDALGIPATGDPLAKWPEYARKNG